MRQDIILDRGPITMKLLTILFTAAVAVFAQNAAALRNIHKVYIEKMPNDLDQYLRAEISKQFKGAVTVVLDKNDADGILAGITRAVLDLSQSRIRASPTHQGASVPQRRT